MEVFHSSSGRWRLTWRLLPSAWSLVTHLQNVLLSGFVIFSLKLLFVWKCSFGPSPWHLWLWSPCHFGFKYSRSSWSPKETQTEYIAFAYMTAISSRRFTGLRRRGSPSDILIGSTLHWKSGVLAPSGSSVTHWVISTPGILDVLLIRTKQKQQSRYKWTKLTNGQSA